MIRRVLIALVLIPQLLSAQSQTGFSAASREKEANAEKVFLDTPTPDRARRWLAQLTEEPHVAGTPQEKKVAEYVLARFKEFGLDAEMTKYDVFLNHPRNVSLELTAPTKMELSLREEPYDVDKDSSSVGMFPATHKFGVCMPHRELLTMSP